MTTSKQNHNPQQHTCYHSPLLTTASQTAAQRTAACSPLLTRRLLPFSLNDGEMQMHALASGGDAAGLVMETLFRVLQEVVRGKSALFAQVFPDVLNLLMNSVVSILDGDGAPVHIQLALFDVLRFVLLDNWRSFYPAPVAPGKAEQASADGSPLNAEALGTILQVRTSLHSPRCCIHPVSFHFVPFVGGWVGGWVSAWLSG
jgi:hypothetical protein